MIGLLQASGHLKGIASPLANIDVHHFVSLGAIYTSVFHAVILLWDQYISFSLADIVVPFASEFAPFLVGLGVLTFYLMLVVSILTYLRRKLSPKMWRLSHQFSLMAFLAVLIHGWFLGTDSQHPTAAFLYRFATYSVVALLIYRIYINRTKGVRGRANTGGRR